MVFCDSRHWACYHNMCLLSPAQAVTLGIGLVITICACYHQPRPIYDTSSFRQVLFDNVSRLLEDASTVSVLTGDLNKLNTDQLQTQLGLVQIVNNPTHNNNILDVFITNRQDLFDVQSGQSLIKTEHKASIVNSRIDCNAAKQRTPRRRV